MENGQFGSKITNAKTGEQNDSTTRLQLLRAKKPLQKNTLMFEKWESIFKVAKIGHNAKAYSLCKMVSLRQKLHRSKWCKKRFSDHIRVVAVKKKTLEKTLNIGENGNIFKMAKNGHNARAIAFGKWSVWVKN